MSKVNKYNVKFKYSIIISIILHCMLIIVTFFITIYHSQKYNPKKDLLSIKTVIVNPEVQQNMFNNRNIKFDSQQRQNKQIQKRQIDIISKKQLNKQRQLNIPKKQLITEQQNKLIKSQKHKIDQQK